MTSSKDFVSGSYRSRKKGMDRPARRLSVRIPTEEWRADISKGGAVYTTARIVNISAGGAYLVVQRPFQLDSIMTMYIKSPHFSFITRARVIRCEQNGIGVRFVDLNGLIKDTILSRATKHLHQRYMKRK